jgi:hypothetical protein
LHPEARIRNHQAKTPGFEEEPPMAAVRLRPGESYLHLKRMVPLGGVVSAKSGQSPPGTINKAARAHCLSYKSIQNGTLSAAPSWSLQDQEAAQRLLRVLARQYL